MVKNLILIILIIFNSCASRNIDNNSDLSYCKLDVIKNGDITSYIKLTNYFEDSTNYFELLPYSLKMIESENIGNSDFYITYMKIKFNGKFNNSNFAKLKKFEQDYLIEILKNGAKNDSYSCEEILKEISPNLPLD